MRLIIMSDPHLGKFWKINNSVSNRAEKLYNYFLYNLNLHAKKDNALIIAGDVYDSVHANVEMLIKFRKELDRMFSKYGNVKIIAGNHETFIDKNGVQQSLLELGLSNTDNVISNGIKSYQWKDLQSNAPNNVNFILLPFQRNFTDALSNKVPSCFQQQDINIIISHETPKEIFSYSKFSMNDILQEYKKYQINIPCIILGHYHKPTIVQLDETSIISIGNSYYHTLDDIRDINKPKLTKRYLIITTLDDCAALESEMQNYGCKKLLAVSNIVIYSVNYILPKVYQFDVDDQDSFNKNILSDMRSIKDKDLDAIFWIRSKVLIDYSQAMFEGCDVYFDLIEDAKDSILSLDEASTTNAVENIANGQTLLERWNTFLKLSGLSKEQCKLAKFLFDKRNDSNITPDSIMDVLFSKDESQTVEDNGGVTNEHERSSEDIWSDFDQF